MVILNLIQEMKKHTLRTNILEVSRFFVLKVRNELEDCGNEMSSVATKRNVLNNQVP